MDKFFGFLILLRCHDYFIRMETHLKLFELTWAIFVGRSRVKIRHKFYFSVIYLRFKHFPVVKIYCKIKYGYILQKVVALGNQKIK